MIKKIYVYVFGKNVNREYYMFDNIISNLFFDLIFVVLYP